MHGCRISSIPKTNRRFWMNKLSGNVKRDFISLKELKRLGWKVKVIWECEIENNFPKVLNRLTKELI